MPGRSQKAKNWSYEQSIASLEDTLQQIESGTLPLEAVFKQFAIAIEEIKQCEAFLQQGKAEMNLLIEQLEDDEDDLDF